MPQKANSDSGATRNGSHWSMVIRDSLRIGLLLCVPALVAWSTGRPFIFPSLGPSAFWLVSERKGGEVGLTVLGGHLIGVLCGLAAYHLLAEGLALSRLPLSQSMPLLSLAASGVLSLVLTSAGMLATGLRHAPACATTLIVSFGLLSTWWDGVFIMVAVAMMFGVHIITTYKRG
jgi:hypothetical protein